MELYLSHVETLFKNNIGSTLYNLYKITEYIDWKKQPELKSLNYDSFNFYHIIHKKLMTIKKLVIDVTTDNMNMIVIILNLYDNKRKTSVNFGSTFIENIITATNDILSINMISLYPSFISCDGEYRANLIMFGIYQYIFQDPEQSNVIDELVEHINYICKRRGWYTQLLYFTPKLAETEQIHKIEQYFREKNIALNCLSI